MKQNGTGSSAAFLLCSIALLACFSLFVSDWRALAAFSAFIAVCALFLDAKRRLELSPDKSKAHAGSLIPKAYHATSIITAGVFLFALSVPPVSAGFTLKNFSQSLLLSLSSAFCWLRLILQFIFSLIAASLLCHWQTLFHSKKSRGNCFVLLRKKHGSGV